LCPPNIPRATTGSPASETLRMRGVTAVPAVFQGSEVHLQPLPQPIDFNELVAEGVASEPFSPFSDQDHKVRFANRNSSIMENSQLRTRTGIIHSPAADKADALSRIVSVIVPIELIFDGNITNETLALQFGQYGRYI
jgi:hypothetical protein